MKEKVTKKAAIRNLREAFELFKEGECFQEQYFTVLFQQSASDESYQS